jgi:hypothetical protein
MVGMRGRRRNIAWRQLGCVSVCGGELINGSATIAAHHDAHQSTRFTQPNMAYSLAAAAAAIGLNKTQHPARQNGRGRAERTTITVHPRAMSSAPLDGMPVRLFASVGSAIASFWSAERSRKAFGPGDYREGWFLLDDDAVELDEPMGWEPLTSERA